ncbi:tetraacyldisaccharide 4'-kinase [Aestuariicella hydrocarbonica]|uniref:Tetraacyldisaccharide 4'-kinase n=1 Tax=Pseudomaricurvus hydrocarbonicus TaxID=1470433 RepID=A0A9E5JR84_9GAMM|nr:tetraacyldisaccharide 4'-kinase [Aestuariicella hydrocarbonica]NHO65223.1 tetraacyldisaccharide 4'-kinase [Aestuariicella hydrocarbonica]
MSSPRDGGSANSGSLPRPRGQSSSGQEFWLNAWYEGRWWLWLLWPLSLILQGIAGWRRTRLMRHAQTLPAPVLVVGNITLGGTGKTPVIITLVRYLRSLGLNPGVISRGYGGHAPYFPYLVTPQSPVDESGDEPLLIALETGCPVMVGANRVQSVETLAARHHCDIILSDDGMQHYKLARDWELCLLDGQRLLGNGLCLPAGPLREAPGRLREVDCVILNGGTDKPDLPVDVEALRMSLIPKYWCNVLTGERVGLDQLPFLALPGVHAVTGIGNPERFFTTLRELGIAVEGQAFPDHYAFSEADLAHIGTKPLLMTAKDAVKCRNFAKPDWWYLSVEAELPQAFYTQLHAFLSVTGLSISVAD